MCGCELRLVSMGIELGGTRRRDETMGGPSGRMSRWMDGWMGVSREVRIKGSVDGWRREWIEVRLWHSLSLVSFVFEKMAQM